VTIENRIEKLEVQTSVDVSRERADEISGFRQDLIHLGIIRLQFDVKEWDVGTLHAHGPDEEKARDAKLRYNRALITANWSPAARRFIERNDGLLNHMKYKL
jgi:hypothetical protein